VASTSEMFQLACVELGNTFYACVPLSKNRHFFPHYMTVSHIVCCALS